LRIAVYCAADDLLSTTRANARRRVSDAEVVTVCVAQAIMGIPSDRRVLALARRQLGHLFPHRPGQSGYHKRRRAPAETIAWLIGVFAGRSPGSEDRLSLIDSTPVECARSVETIKRSALGVAADDG
jgi:Transposase DDE domain